MRRLAGLGLLLAAGAAPATPLDDAIACMRGNLPEAVRIQTVELAAHDRAGGVRVLRGRVFGRRDRDRVQVMARVDLPADLSGAAYLVREAEPSDEVYVFLPSVNRVKRVAAGRAGRWWGTDFSYAEFSLVQSAFDARALRWIGRTEREGRAAYRLAFAPPPAPGTAAPYDDVALVVDAATCVVLEAEFKRGGAVRKRLSVPAAQLRQAAGKWYPGEALLENPVDGTRTQLRVLGVTYADRLAARYFHPQQFMSAY